MEPGLLIFLILFGLLFIIGPILGAFLLDKRHRRLRPASRPFGWGYYNALGAFAVPVFITGQLAKADASAAAVIFLFAAGIYIPLGILTLRRNRWAFVLLTIAFLNPLFWIINTIYISNRWAEMAATDSSVSTSGALPLSAPLPTEFKFSCPHCGQHIATTTDCVGTAGSCPTCQNALTVPSPSA